MYYIIGTEKRYLELYDELKNFIAVDILDLILERCRYLMKAMEKKETWRKTWEVIVRYSQPQ